MQRFCVVVNTDIFEKVEQQEAEMWKTGQFIKDVKEALWIEFFWLIEVKFFRDGAGKDDLGRKKPSKKDWMEFEEHCTLIGTRFIMAVLATNTVFQVMSTKQFQDLKAKAESSPGKMTKDEVNFIREVICSTGVSPP